jgi:peptidoglycan/LPS O-acetylase OafA/YrhL
MRFYVSRIARIWPVHLFALGLIIVLLPLPAFGVLPTIANILMIHAWVPIAAYGFSYNAVSWSISTEMGFYLLFPLLLRWSWPLKLAVPAALLIGSIAICHIFALPPYDGREVVSNFPILFFNPLARLFEFGMGMCGATLYAHSRQRLGNSVLLWTLAEIATVSALVWYVFFAMRNLWDFAKAGIVPVSVEYLYHASAGPFFALIILALAGERGLLARFLALRPVVFLGNISFALYMTHQILISVYVAHSAQFPLSFPALVALLLIFAAAVHLGIEKPARALIVGAFDGLPRLKTA